MRPMNAADAVLITIPATYFVTAVALAPLGTPPSTALGLASLVAVVLVGRALFVDPPT